MRADESLALRAAEGDPRAFEQIYERYHQELYRFCLAMVGNPQDAQDALQNTMVKVLRSLPGEKREIRLRPWLYRIARNESVETLRKRRDSAELEQHEPTVVGVTETAEARERLRSLLDDLDQLPERQRAALVMRELSDLDFDQIGAAFGTSAAVARQTLYEARLSLRKLEAGREMRCEEVMRELSDADGRVTRRREIQAHLRSCADCRAFGESIVSRRKDLAALSPLPLAISAGLLHGLLGNAAGASGAAAAGGAAGGGVAAGAGKAVASSALLKGAAAVAVAVVGVSAAQRSGLVDLPLPGNDGSKAVQSATREHGSNGNAPPAAKGTAAASVNRDDSAAGGAHGEAPSRRDDVPAKLTPAVPAGSESRSESGQAPPGGGYGRSASGTHGRPEHLPQAAEQGQQTAAVHKAGQPPAAGPSGSPAERGKSTGAPAKEPAPKAEPEAEPREARSPPLEAPKAAGGAHVPPAKAPSPPSAPPDDREHSSTTGSPRSARSLQGRCQLVFPAGNRRIRTRRQDETPAEADDRDRRPGAERAARRPGDGRYDLHPERTARSAGTQARPPGTRKGLRGHLPR
jgi:RNA polymerase sigma factor (sigma-70 family)